MNTYGIRKAKVELGKWLMDISKEKDDRKINKKRQLIMGAVIVSVYVLLIAIGGAVFFHFAEKGSSVRSGR